MYSIIAEKTGWTPKQISNLNLETVRYLTDAWSEKAKEASDQVKGNKKAKPATVSDIKMMQRLLEGVK